MYLSIIIIHYTYIANNFWMISYIDYVGTYNSYDPSASKYHHPPTFYFTIKSSFVALYAWLLCSYSVYQVIAAIFCSNKSKRAPQSMQCLILKPITGKGRGPIWAQYQCQHTHLIDIPLLSFSNQLHCWKTFVLHELVNANQAQWSY